MSNISNYRRAGKALESYLKGNSFSHHLSEITDKKLRQRVISDIEVHKKSGNGHLEARIELYKAKAEIEEIGQIVNCLVNEIVLSEEDDCGDEECVFCKNRISYDSNN